MPLTYIGILFIYYGELHEVPTKLEAFLLVTDLTSSYIYCFEAQNKYKEINRPQIHMCITSAESEVDCRVLWPRFGRQLRRREVHRSMNQCGIVAIVADQSCWAAEAAGRHELVG